jgi:hypothetical protein
VAGGSGAPADGAGGVASTSPKIKLVFDSDLKITSSPALICAHLGDGAIGDAGSCCGLRSGSWDLTALRLPRSSGVHSQQHIFDGKRPPSC